MDKIKVLCFSLFSVVSIEGMSMQEIETIIKLMAEVAIAILNIYFIFKKTKK